MIKMGVKAEVVGDNNIVIQKVDGSTITINTENAEEVRKALIELQTVVTELPDNIVRKLMESNNSAVPTVGANIYLGLDLLITGKGIMGVSLSVQITNLTKEIRFYNKPFFKVSTPFEKGADTFLLTNTVGTPIDFPSKMEYGEVIKEAYQIVPANIELFKNLLGKDPNATITAFVSTTLGELYKSDPYKVSDIIKQEDYIR